MRTSRLLFLLGLVACQPDLGEPSSLVQSPRILAVRSQPAEAAPGADVTLTLLLATASGETTATEVDWAFCATPKPPVDNNVISDACLGDAVRGIAGRAAQVSATLPADACALFGPQLPPTPAGQPPARPRDPDGGGGYYQPVRARPLAWSGQRGQSGADGGRGIGLLRILCGLAGASAQLAAAYRDQYQANRNPQLAGARVTRGDQELSLNALPIGQTLQLHVAWNADAAERFPVLDSASQRLVEQTESLQVAWFANAGRFALAHTVAGDGKAESVNEWTAPLQPGPVTVWIVLRDSRGGVDWLALALSIQRG